MTYDSFAKKVKEKFRLDWAEFFSSFTNREKKMIWNDFNFLNESGSDGNA